MMWLQKVLVDFDRMLVYNYFVFMIPELDPSSEGFLFAQKRGIMCDSYFQLTTAIRL